jgi:hypothetical protein
MEGYIYAFSSDTPSPKDLRALSFTTSHAPGRVRRGLSGFCKVRYQLKPSCVGN